MKRHCPTCGAALAPLALRCACGTELPEARDTVSTPDEPRCGVCGRAMALMDVQCPSCSAAGYPALRSRRGKKTLGAPPDGFQSPPG